MWEGAEGFRAVLMFGVSLRHWATRVSFAHTFPLDKYTPKSIEKWCDVYMFEKIVFEVRQASIILVRLAVRICQ